MAGALASGVAALLGAAPVDAQRPVQAHTTDTARVAVRPRFAVGAYGGYATGGTTIGTGVLVYVRGGVQFTELLGLGLQASAVTILFANDVRLAATLDFATADWFSVGTGAAAHVLLGHEAGLGVLVGVPLRVAFHLFALRGRNNGRHAFEILFEGDVGVAHVIGNGFSSAGSATYFGAAAYAGLGYAMY